MHIFCYFDFLFTRIDITLSSKWNISKNSACVYVFSQYVIKIHILFVKFDWYMGFLLFFFFFIALNPTQCVILKLVLLLSVCVNIFSAFPSHNSFSTYTIAAITVWALIFLYEKIFHCSALKNYPKHRFINTPIQWRAKTTSNSWNSFNWTFTQFIQIMWMLTTQQKFIVH